MPTIIRYQIVIDSLTTHRLNDLNSPEGPLCTELCTLDDGYTYVSVPDGVTLPQEQPVSVTASLEPVTLTDALREQIKAASPHTQLIARRVVDRIRERYSADDELYFARIMIGSQSGLYTLEPGEMDEVTAFKTWVEAARQWGRDQRALLGL